MTVEELIKELEKLPKHDVVVLSEEIKKDVYGWTNIEKVVHQGNSVHIVQSEDNLFDN